MVYGALNLPVSKLRDLDVVRSLKVIIDGLKQLEQQVSPPQSDGDQLKQGAQPIDVPLVKIFDIAILEAALAGLEEHLIVIVDYQNQRKARVDAVNKVRKRINIIFRKVAGSIRLACIEDSRVDLREKLRAFGFRFEGYSDVAPGVDDSGDAASAEDSAPAPAEAEASGLAEVAPEALASQG